MFKIGQVYRRATEIHDVYGGQRNGGISTPKQHGMVLLFFGDAGEDFGYEDKFHDGIFWYTGEGQVGDMQMVRGNAAIRDHESDGKALYLFEIVGQGNVRHVGQATYLGHHTEQRPDRNGDIRQAIVFELEVDSTSTLPEPVHPSSGRADTPTAERLWSRPINEIRDLAIQRPPTHVSKVERRQYTAVRSEAVKVYVLRRANGKCECCNAPAPFKRRGNHRPYLEPHHLTRLADGGPDHPASVAAVCPNCHRKIHYGEGGDQMNAELAERIVELED